jgi:hypothetical protein
VLGDELVSIAEVRRSIPPDAGCVGHEHVDEVVDDDRHLDAVDGLEGDWPGFSHRFEHRRTGRVRQGAPPHQGDGSGRSATLSWTIPARAKL